MANTYTHILGKPVAITFERSNLALKYIGRVEEIDGDGYIILLPCSSLELNSIPDEFFAILSSDFVTGKTHIKIENIVSITEIETLTMELYTSVIKRLEKINERAENI